MMTAHVEWCGTINNIENRMSEDWPDGRFVCAVSRSAAPGSRARRSVPSTIRSPMSGASVARWYDNIICGRWPRGATDANSVAAIGTI